MRHFITISLFLFSISMLAAPKADKKLLKQMKADVETVKTNLKTGKDLANMEELMRKHLSDSAFCNDISLHVLLTEVIKKEYEIGNEKMYLKSSLDTTCFMNTSRRLFVACLQLDSLDAVPDINGHSAPNHRRRNAEYLAPIRKNIFNGGLYFFKHKQWNDSWKMFDTYLSSRKQPLFTDVPLDSINDSYAAYVAVMAAGNLNSLSKAKLYADEALTYKPAEEVTLQTLAELSRTQSDTDFYVKCLKQGFEKYPLSTYFFPHLIDYLSDKSDYDGALYFVNKAMECDSLNVLFLLAKHSLLMNKQDYEGALTFGERLLTLNDSLSQPNYNVGYIYYQKAQQAMKRGGVSYRQRMNDAQKYYRLLLPFMSRYRKLKPEDKHRWKPILYDTYLNLNMGKEFQQLEKE